ncbi:MAG: M20/M25/M40 family metallo-hydrolase [Candidatus Hydrogenedentota bacterium]
MPSFLPCRAPGGVALILLLVLLAFAAVSWYTNQPPAPVSADAPERDFSAERAFVHVEAIAQEPHPAGTEANRRVRDYIMAQVRACGESPELQRAFIHWCADRAATVENIVVRVAGTENSGQAVGLMAHYDSVASGPGAADNTGGVATLLETMRAIKAGPAPEHDVVFLFTDGEEARLQGSAGRRGARAFVSKHPLAETVRVMLNFDFRGNAGPTYMYETSPENGWIARQVAAADCAPLASSLMYALYRSMPVNSDLTPWLAAEKAGLNFAAVDGFPVYHTERDTPENLSLASLEHHGRYALGLTRHMGNGPLDTVAAPNRVYFNIAGPWLVHYPEAWSLAFAVLAAALWLFAVWVARRRGLLTWPGLGVGAGLFVAVLAVAAGLGGLAAVLGYQARGVYILYSSDAFTLAVLLAGAAGLLATLYTVTRRHGVYAAALGPLAVWSVAALVSAAVIPGAAYLFTWPLLFAAASLLILARAGNPLTRPGWGAAAVLALGAAPGMLLLPYTLLGIHATLMVIFSALTVAGLVLLGGVVAAPLTLATYRLRRILPAALAVGAVLCLIVGLRWPGFSPEQPKLNCVTYVLDADTGAARWVSTDEQPDEWQAQFFTGAARRGPLPDFYPNGTGDYLQDDAPALSVEAPRMELQQEETVDSRRVLHFHVSSPREAPVLKLFALEGTQVLGGSINGIPLLPTTDNWYLSNGMCAPEGFDLTLELAADGPAVFRVVSHTYGLPEDLAYDPRPAHMIMKPNTPDFNREPLKTDEFVVGTTLSF